MTALIALLIWCVAGVVAEARYTRPGSSRWAWTPIAAILGPLWPAIAREQYASASDAPREARLGVDRGLPGLPSPALAIVRPTIDTPSTEAETSSP